MKRSIKYVGLDVHQATTVSTVRDEAGRVLARTVVPTEAEALMGFFRSMPALSPLAPNPVSVTHVLRLFCHLSP